ncbi:10284_t:CDS:2, partial [Racocetra persica]
FEGRAISGGAFCDGCTSDNDEHGHGTNVAGIVAGKTFGVAKKSTVISVKVLNAGGSGGLSGLLDGLISDAINNAVKALTDAGIHVAVAAGNNAGDACESSPSSEPSAITVGAVQIDPNDKEKDKIAFFSNFGKCVDIFAPGLAVVSAGVFTDFDISAFSGTSQATPHVAGTIALIIAKSGNQ